MGMTYVDIDVLEQIKVNMNDVLNQVLECEGTLKQQFSQMQTEPVELDGYPEWGKIKNLCDDTIMELVVIREDIEQLLTVLETVPTEYKEMEKKYANLVQQVSTKMSNLQALLSGAVAIDYPVNMETDNVENGKNVERDVESAMVSMEISNLNAITRTLEEEYAYESVVPNVPEQELDL